VTSSPKDQPVSLIPKRSLLEQVKDENCREPANPGLLGKWP